MSKTGDKADVRDPQASTAGYFICIVGAGIRAKGSVGGDLSKTKTRRQTLSPQLRMGNGEWGILNVKDSIQASGVDMGPV